MSNNTKNFKERECKHCKKIFKPNHASKAYCSIECRNAYNRERARLAEAAKRQKKKKKQTLAEITRAAKAAGMSYGKYVLQMEKEENDQTRIY